MEMTKLKKLHKSETQEKNYMSLKIQMQLRNDHQDERDDMLDRIADLNVRRACLRPYRLESWKR